MKPTLCAIMAQYNSWMNRRLYDAAATLSDTQILEGRGAFFGSIFGTLNHIVVGDLIWMHRFAQLQGFDAINSALATFPSPTALRQGVAKSLPELNALRVNLDEVITKFAGLITEQHLAQTLRYTTTTGDAQAKNFGLLLQHFFNHQTHHRGQATTLLFQAGVDIGVTDLNALIPNAA